MDQRIQFVLDFISLNLHKKITLSDACRVANLSSSRLCELFKKETGQTLFECIYEARMKKACKLLKKSSFSIKYISCEVGYRYVCNFDRDFKKFKGVSPSEYKKYQQSVNVVILLQRMVSLIYRLIVKFANIFVRFANKK